MCPTTSFSTINSVNLIEDLLGAEQVASNIQLDKCLLRVSVVKPKADPVKPQCWVSEGWSISRHRLHVIMHFVSPSGKTHSCLHPCFFSILLKLTKVQILTLHRLLEHGILVAISTSWRKLRLLTFYTAQNRYCCCQDKPAQAASAKCCENFGTENVLVEVSETRGLAEFLKQ